MIRFMQSKYSILFLIYILHNYRELKKYLERNFLSYFYWKKFFFFYIDFNTRNGPGSNIKRSIYLQFILYNTSWNYKCVDIFYSRPLSLNLKNVQIIYLFVNID